MLFDRYHGRVFRHVVGLLDSSGDADDVAAATFLELWRRRFDVRLVDGSVLPWLLVAAGYLARNQGRQTRRYRAILEELPRERREVDPAEEAERRIEFRDQSGRVATAISRLRPKDAQLIAMTALSDCSVAQAGEALGLSPGAARVRLHRARARLRTLVPDLVTAPAKEDAQ